LLNPGLAYLTSSLGCFLGLQCTARARAMQGAQRIRWLLLAAVSIGATGIWVMHFIAMLGFTIPGQAITYNVPATILSMLIAVGVVSVGLLIVGFGGEGTGPLLLGGTIIGIGVASMHYMGMWAMRMPDTMGYNTGLLAVSVLIAIVAGTGMAAMQLRAAPGAGMAAMGSGASAESFLLPLILGITILTFLVTAIVTLAPTEAEIREDAALMERITRLSEGLERRSS
jgi:NO-binding membrane sensor protein with MHYT domain